MTPKTENNYEVRNAATSGLSENINLEIGLVKMWELKYLVFKKWKFLEKHLE